MKKRFLLVLAALFACVALQAQFISAISMAVPHYYPGEIYFMDGHTEEFAEIELPKGGKSKIGVKKDAADKKHYDIDAADIRALKISHKKFPEMEHVLFHVPIKKEFMHAHDQWGMLVMHSEWGNLFLCEKQYVINNSTGDIEYVKTREYNTITWYYYLLPAGWDEGRVLITKQDIYGFTKKKVKQTFIGGAKRAAEFFKENTKIHDGILSGEITADDMQYILDEMAGGKKAEEPLKIIPEIQTDSVSNGVVGDDE